MISINDVPLTSLAIEAWEGQLWINIYYPANVSVGDVMKVQDGLTVGNSVLEGFTLKLNSNSKWEYEGQAKYSRIYSNDFNNTQKFDGYNQVLIVYIGPSHGLTGDARTITDQATLGMISINDVPLTSLAIEAWDGQLWIDIYYPNTVSTGDVMKVQDGLTIGNAVFNGFALRLNSSSKWEKVDLVNHDKLVKNNDYLLITPSSVSSDSNSAWPFYSPNAVSEMANLNFGLQFKVNMTDAQLGGYEVFKLGSTFAGEDFLQLIINFKVNTYISKFKNVACDPLIGLTSISVTPDVDHIFEFYCLKVTDTTACFILGIDGIIIFKTSALDLTDAPACTYFGMLNGGAAVSSGVSSLTTTNGAALERFSNNALLMDTIPTSNVGETDACKGANGHYAKAKAYYNNYLVESQRAEFATNAAYSEERARMIAWGAANGENISFNSSTGAIVVGSNFNLLFVTFNNNTSTYIIIAFSLVSVVALSVFFLYMKKKQNN